MNKDVAEDILVKINQMKKDKQDKKDHEETESFDLNSISKDGLNELKKKPKDSNKKSSTKDILDDMMKEFNG